MKRFFLFIGRTVLLIIVPFLFTSCQNENNWTERQILDLVQKGLLDNSWKVLSLTVEQNDWQYNPEINEYFYTFDLPELTDLIFDQGAVIGTIVLSNGKEMSPLPYVSEDRGVFSCRFSKGSPATVTFIYTSETISSTDAPLTSEFKVIMHW